MSPPERLIGGEFSCQFGGESYAITNTGRSSLRLILESISVQEKKVLLPNFLCETICDVFKEFNVETTFYEVSEEFEASLESFQQENTILYVIRYFGANWGFVDWAVRNWDTTLIIDDTFGIFQGPIKRRAPYYYFNSLRKIAPF